MSRFRRLFGSGSEREDKSVVPTGTEHDYRPHHCSRSHDWAVQGTGVASGTRVTMRIEAWGARFRVGDRIVIGSPAETWWIVGVTKDGNTWFPDRALLELADTLEQS
ncbi:hypothetical protein Prum_058430 [Phytohabitans rumicis]|uniref:Uncharacterized protein n=1 Tax=Phytohabitans rumicis TaxID=1076125 RepID=A0A6V8LBP5_9ACTN|nr:hypothetical protein Prum_058430 [Phytohabitans rumicis]